MTVFEPISMLYRFIQILVTLCIIFVPLGLWKLIELILGLL